MYQIISEEEIIMKLYTIAADGREQVCVEALQTERLIPVEQCLGYAASMQELLEKASDADWQKLREAASSEREGFQKEAVRILAPIPKPRQDVICLGINYTAHAEEAERFQSETFGGERPWPIYFSKRCMYAPGDGEGIPAYEDLVDGLDYECELGVVIGKTAKGVSMQDAFEYVFGYTIINDVSARNLQSRHKQWYLGKSLDNFTPMGPCIVSKDEFPVPPALPIRSYVNGELRQNSTTNLLITPISRIVSELSTGMTLLPGTLIATGTPAGVGMGFTPPKFLKRGDEVICEIEGIGRITNPIL